MKLTYGIFFSSFLLGSFLNASSFRYFLWGGLWGRPCIPPILQDRREEFFRCCLVHLCIAELCKTCLQPVFLVGRCPLAASHVGESCGGSGTFRIQVVLMNAYKSVSYERMCLPQCNVASYVPPPVVYFFWYVNRLISKEIYLRTTLNFRAEALFQVISIQETTCGSFYIPRQVRRRCKLRTRPRHEVISQ